MKSSNVAPIGRRTHLDPIYPSVWREQLRALARWVLLALIGWLLFGLLAVLAHYA